MKILRIPSLVCALLLPLSAQDAEPEVPPAPAPEKLNAFPLQIPDGAAIVLKKGDAIGIVIITKQVTDPEQCTFEWLLRTDEKILDFGKDAPGLKQGRKENAKTLEFGPFDFEWSMGGTGHGWVYFPDAETYMGVIIGAKREDLHTRLPGVPLIRNATAETLHLRDILIGR